MALLVPDAAGAPPRLDGPVRLLLLADTHLPQRAKELPEEVWRAVDEADLVVHAGDWVDEAALDALEARAARLLAVWGNNDPEGLRARLPEVAHAVVGGLRIAVIHETGAATGREARADTAHPDTDVLVFGHSHIPWDSTSPAGMRLLNPGSPTDRRRQPACTYLTAVAEAGALHDVRLVELPPRAPAAPRLR
ncbi:metallophosphoesterase [Rathayibacter sp. SD072]|uniref:metallophosphoesterase family protein n=1 Tax=Rathayibacter sp. SD072 TaxID=2781731 RepID=UPI001A9737A3|nr:metallophosphoesterase [Rathayibacter sp. SD072]MBO0984600.1 metallophosphoesterase [Rathayibacter sp. SD072]